MVRRRLGRVRLLGRTSRRICASQVSVPLVVVRGSGRQPNHIIYQLTNTTPSVASAITAAREGATGPAVALSLTPQPFTVPFFFCAEASVRVGWGLSDR